MSDSRRLSALVIAALGFGCAVFGVVLGLSSGGPAAGTRYVVAIDAPDEAAVELAQQALVARLGDRARVVAAGGRLVVETGDGARGAIERTPRLEVTAGLDGPITHVEALSGGIAIVAANHVPRGATLAVALDGAPVGSARVDDATPTELHALSDHPQPLVDAIASGAAHPMRVVEQTAFTRRTGFFARAWPFFAAFGALLAIAAVVWR